MRARAGLNLSQPLGDLGALGEVFGQNEEFLGSCPSTLRIGVHQPVGVVHGCWGCPDAVEANPSGSMPE
jgi:hypothetical protein